MKFTGDPEKDKTISQNRASFLQSIGVNPDQLVSAQLEHGNNAVVIISSKGFEFIPHTDALLTNQENIFLSITVADCLPIYLYDPSSSTIGIIHAGWKGLKKDIIKETITKAQKELDLDPTRTLIEIGPSIGACHFEVQQDVADQFEEYLNGISKREGKTYLDLKKIAEAQLLETGINKENIEVSSICTYDDQNYFSYRRDKSNPVEAQITVIGLKK